MILQTKNLRTPKSFRYSYPSVSTKNKTCYKTIEFNVLSLDETTCHVTWRW